MTQWLKKIHKWLGLLIGLQLLLWMASGVVMSLLDAEKVRGREFRVPPAARAAWPAQALPVSQALKTVQVDAQSVSTGWLGQEPVYRLATDQGVRLISALRGTEIVLDGGLAQRLAQASYRGPGQAGPAELQPPSLETRAHEGKVWRVPFSDGDDTTVYLSQHGDVLEHRNSTWRLFDFFWMLHIMDYTGRKDFNNPLVVSAAVGGLWLALSGIWLLFTSFRLADFIPRRLRASKSLQVLSSDGSRLRTLRVTSGDTVFVAMGKQGLQLPSNCGGGQSCGLCEVKVCGNVPAATPADRAQLSLAKLRDGHRLACNLHVTSDLEIEVLGGVELWSQHGARVESVTALSPTLRELVLLPDERADAAYRPGSYIQVIVPAYQMSGAQIELPEAHRTAWAAWRLPSSWGNSAPLRRSYSLSAPVEQIDGRISLLVRFLHGPAGASHHPPGKGSSYMYGLKPGDRIQYAGPFGDFALHQGQREKVFIGGGAGMAPLRAMIRSLLEGGAKERVHFWYGARTQADAPYVEEMQALATRFGNFSWHLVLSGDAAQPAGAGDRLPRALVHDAVREQLLESHANLAACEFYLCGPPAMLSATRKMLRKLGIADAQVAFDDFKI